MNKNNISIKSFEFIYKNLNNKKGEAKDQNNKENPHLSKLWILFCKREKRENDDKTLTSPNEHKHKKRGSSSLQLHFKL